MVSFISHRYPCLGQMSRFPEWGGFELGEAIQGHFHFGVRCFQGDTRQKYPRLRFATVYCLIACHRGAVVRKLQFSVFRYNHSPRVSQERIARAEAVAPKPKVVKLTPEQVQAANDVQYYSVLKRQQESMYPYPYALLRT